MKRIDSKLILDAKDESASRRYRNILANSGQVMESGEIRDIENLYVMGYDGKLIKISDLNTNPDKQTEHYAVKAQADHGELIEGELVPSIEKQFGSCKVWLEADGLHARMYFADNDPLADHAWAISMDASYSTGIDWYPDGYYGMGYEIPTPIGILREVSMVLTGNDGRAKTIDTKPAESEAQRSEDADGDNNNNLEGDEMSEIKKDALTRGEEGKLLEELAGVIDKFTADVPESETQPTVKDSEGEAEETAKEETKDTVKHSPIVVVRDRVVKQPVVATTDTKNWVTSKDGHIAFANCLKQAGRFGARFDALWAQEAAKHMKLDGITGLPTPIPTQSFEAAIEKKDGILNKLTHLNTKAYRANILSLGDGDDIETARAHGHKKGDTKINQVVADTYRNVICKMVYKKLDIDAMELYNNPELIDFRAQELLEEIMVEIERAAIIGDGRTYTTGADYRMFDGTSAGFFSIKADAAAGTGFGALVTDTIAPTTAEAYNLYDKVVLARNKIKTEGAQFVVCKKSLVSALRLAKANGQYLLPPGASVEQMLGVSAVYTPTWMDSDTDNDAYLIVEGAYKTIGESEINTRTDFDLSTNVDVMLAESPRGGTLDKFKSAVAIKVEE